MPYRVIRKDGLFIEYKKTPQEKQIDKIENENAELRKELDELKQLVKNLSESK